MDLWTAFVLGLVGSLHCAGMCGPLAMALPNAGNRPVPYVVGRIAYNAGRIVTYSLLGLVCGVVGQTLLLAGVLRGVSITLGLLLLFGSFASRKVGLRRPMSVLVERIKSGIGEMLRRRSWSAFLVLGLLNGLLPCGLVYVAATGAITTGTVLKGMGFMAAFGVGTIPLMLAISLSGKLMPISFRLKLQRVLPVSIFLLAALLILRGMSLGIPYVSPDLSSGASCCQK